MKLATWNINSIRAREERLLTWLGQERPDVLCLQETKVEDSGFPLAPIRKLGYEVATFGQRSYNGVAIASTQPLVDVSRGFGDGADDEDARVIAATTHGIRVVCVYVPNGQELTSDRYPYKLAWFKRLRAYLDRTAAPDQPLAVCGDMNVAPDDRDVWSPEKWQGSIHTRAPEREAPAAGSQRQTQPVLRPVLRELSGLVDQPARALADRPRVTERDHRIVAPAAVSYTHLR